MMQPAPHPSVLPLPADRATRTRQRILDSAGGLFAERGYSKTTVEEIASVAGVSKGIVYHHFQSKDGLLGSLLERLVREWIEVSDLALWRARSDGLETALASMIRASTSYARGNPLVRGLFQLDPMVVRGLGSRDTVRQLARDARLRMVDALSAARARGELRAGLAPQRVAEVVDLLTVALIEHLLDPGQLDAPDDDDFVESCLAVLFHGISGGGAR